MTDKEYFEMYPDNEECFQTFDGFIFHKEHDAKAHAHSLKIKKVARFLRNQEQEAAKREEPVAEEPEQEEDSSATVQAQEPKVRKAAKK